MAVQRLRGASRRPLLSLLLSLLFLASLLGPATAWTPARSVEELKMDQELEEAILSRATGDQYLLGVGKADITGYA
jgi:hypothetical protein